MLNYIIRRLLLTLPTLFGITIIAFTITRFVPGGPVEDMIMQMQVGSMDGGSSGSNSKSSAGDSLSPEVLAQLNEFYGLDKPPMTAYLDWLGKVVQFDLGESTRFQDPVWDMIIERLPVSLFYGLSSFLITYLVCIPLGIAKAIKHNTAFDNISSIAIFVGYAVPGFVLGVLLLASVARHVDWIPMGGFVSDEYDFHENTWDRIVDVLQHALLPLICYMIESFALLTMLMKNSLMENMAADYMKTAVAKGVPFNRAVIRHAMRNSLVPIATGFGSILTIFLGGSFLIESIFNIDGIGLLGYQSLIGRDYPVVMGLLVVTSVLVLLGNILSDIAVAIVDPRVKFD